MWAIITGSSRGLGENIALALANRGYNIILHGRDIASLNRISNGLSLDNEIVLGDIKRESTIEKLYDVAKRRDIGILINNAGVYSHKNFEQETQLDFYDILDTNLLSPINLIRRIYPIFKRKKSGLIVNINSLAGLSGNPEECAYCTSKFGLHGFSSSLREYAIRDGIKVMDVFLGAMNTQMTRKRKDQSKCIDPKEAAEVIADLCKDYKTLKVDEVILTRRLK